MTNNNYPNNNGYIGGMNPAGYTAQMNPNPIKFTQTLTKEQISALRQTTDKFSLGLTQEDVWRGICFHRDENNNPTLNENPDGTTTCTICGYTFDPTQEMTEEEVQAAVNGIVDILQTIKLLYLDMPVQAAQEYFQIIPLLEKAPKLFKVASDNFNRHEQWNNYRFNGTPNTINLYNMLNSGAAAQIWAQQQQNPYMNSGFNGMGYQQPMMGQPMMGQPMPMGAPMGAAPMGVTGMMGQPIANGSNGIVNYNMPQQGYQPGTPANFQYNAPMNNAAESAPQGSVPPTSNVANQSADGKNVEVTSTFKS